MQCARGRRNPATKVAVAVLMYQGEMSDTPLQLSFPPGTELVFGPQAARRTRIDSELARVMHGWGFDEIILPGFDVPETFESLSSDAGLYRLVDREGHNLVLRADFTQIASKALAMELRRDRRQIRATYEGRVYRFQPSGHGHRVEQSQRGLEWVNAPGPLFDAACILIARECLQAVGIGNAVIVVGHAGFVNAVLGQRGGQDRRLHEALDHKNPSRIRELALRMGLDGDSARLLETLPLLTGGAEVLRQASQFNLSPAARDALADLEAIDALLAQSGANDVLFDLGEVRQFHYYSGAMFKVYSSAVGEELGGGGRYDRLYDRFGLDVPAVGFGFNLARLTEAAPRDFGGDAKPAAVSAAAPGALRQALALRAQGKAVALGDLP